MEHPGQLEPYTKSNIPADTMTRTLFPDSLSELQETYKDIFFRLVPSVNQDQITVSEDRMEYYARTCAMINSAFTHLRLPGQHQGDKEYFPSQWELPEIEVCNGPTIKVVLALLDDSKSTIPCLRIVKRMGDDYGLVRTALVKQYEDLRRGVTFDGRTLDHLVLATLVLYEPVLKATEIRLSNGSRLRPGVIQLCKLRNRMLANTTAMSQTQLTTNKEFQHKENQPQQFNNSTQSSRLQELLEGPTLKDIEQRSRQTIWQPWGPETPRNDNGHRYKMRNRKAQ